MKDIYVTKAFLPPIDEYYDMIREIWSNNRLSNMGPLHNQFEKAVKDFTGAKECVLFCNGHTALEMIISAMELEGEVITTPFTFASTTHAIVRNGLTPVFCDIKENDFTMNPDKIEALITDKTSAIIPVHVYGNPCDDEKIEKIAKKYGLKVIYDAAHAFGVKKNSISIACSGDASVLSFHATKTINSIEGGAVICKDHVLAEKLRKLRNFGIGEDDVYEIGANAKMNEFQAAMGLCNLKYYDSIVDKRRKMVVSYQSQLRNIDGIMIPSEKEHVESNYSYYPVRILKKHEMNRNQLFNCLEEENIHTRKYFYPLTSELKCYDKFQFPQDTPVAKEISQEILALPLYEQMEIEDVNRICDAIKKFLL